MSSFSLPSWCRVFVPALFLLFLLPGAPAGAGEDGFIGGMDDLPLMAGLTEDASSTMIFESTEGRIIEADATGPVAADAVRRFYSQTLPQLGWKRMGDDRFTRAGEVLKLDLAVVSGGIRVRFRLGPATGN